MKKCILYTVVFALSISACKENKKEVPDDGLPADSLKVAAKPELVQRWTTDTLLTTAESVIYDKERDVLYVSDIAGAPDGADGVGYISQVDLQGKIVNAEWISGLDAPKGLGIIGDKLFVTDLKQIVEIDIETGKVLKKHKVTTAVFLNDITTDNGTVYATDSKDGKIYSLIEGKVNMIADSLAGPNGILKDGDKMLLALWDAKTLNYFDPETREVELIAEDIENPDGIEAVGDGTFLVSSWNGMVHLVDPVSGEKQLLLDTTKEEIGAADIEYIPEKNLLLVPTFFKNGVTAYELKR